MEKLKEVKKYVEAVLREKPYTRNSDNVLYSCVIEALGVPSDMSAAEFFCRAKEIGAPNMESVRRARQKVQAEHPELRGDPDVEAARALNEYVYKEFAING